MNYFEYHIKFPHPTPSPPSTLTLGEPFLCTAALCQTHLFIRTSHLLSYPWHSSVTFSQSLGEVPPSLQGLTPHRELVQGGTRYEEQ